MSLLRKLSDLAKSPEGKRLAEQAKRYATDPKNKQKIDELREKVMKKRPH
jgi:hypothetical protein